MDFLQSFLEWDNMPILSAFILGIMTALSPCPLATNITAVAYIGKNIENKKLVFLNGIIYTLGRAISYVGLGFLFFWGANKFHIASFFQSNGQKVLGFIMLIVGILMLDIFKIRIPGSGKLVQILQNKRSTLAWLSALLMGIVFALAFCPYSGVIYFGILIPMSISNASGLFLPFVFSIGTGLPVIIFAYLIAFTVSRVANLYNRLKTFEKWFRKIVAIVFILVGLYYIYVFYIQ
jgi:cytochrome c-type biogenesis protein